MDTHPEWFGMVHDEMGNAVEKVTHGKMTQGLVVQPYDESFTHCSYCGTKMVWKERSTGYKAYLQKTFGCPRYGNDIAGPLGWHDFWWEDNLFSLIHEDLQNANKSLAK